MAIEHIEPEIGMGVTEYGYSDRHAYTIVDILRSKKSRIISITIRRDITNRIDENGMSESQSYEYIPNPEGQITNLTLRRDGYWREYGCSARGPRFSNPYVVGHRREYHDYSF